MFDLCDHGEKFPNRIVCLFVRCWLVRVRVHKIRLECVFDVLNEPIGENRTNRFLCC